jgi:hypothetical protein
LFFEDKKNILVVKEQENKESSPFSLFGVKSDMELDSELDAALQKSISMIGAADKEEIECCEGHPSKWKEFFDNNVLCDCTIQANDGKVSENDILIGRKKSYIFFITRHSKPTAASWPQAVPSFTKSVAKKSRVK